MADEVFKWCFAVESGRQYQQSIEPSSRLIDSLRNEVTWKTFLKLPLLLKRVVVLCIRHATALKPAVKDLRHTPQDWPGL